MKFVTRQIVAILICVLMMTDVAIAFERKARSFKTHRGLSKSQGRKHRQEPVPADNTPQNNSYFLNVSNKWFALVAGISVGLAGGQTGWMKCLGSWAVAENPSDPEPAETQNEQAIAQQDSEAETAWSPLLTSIVNKVKVVGSYICWAYKSVMSLIKTIIAGLNKLNSRRRFRFKETSSITMSRRNRRFEITFSKAELTAIKKGHYTMSKKNLMKMRDWLDNLVDNVSTAFNNVTNAIFKTADDAYKFIAGGIQIAEDKAKEYLETIVQKAAENFPQAAAVFQSISNYIKDLANTIKYWLTSPIVKKIQELFQCWNQLQAFSSSIQNTINAVWSKIQTIITGFSGGPAGLAAIADVLLACLCNWDAFVNAATNFQIASQQSTDVKKYEYWGKGIGWILNTIGSSPTISQTYQNALKEAAEED